MMRSNWKDDASGQLQRPRRVQRLDSNNSTNSSATQHLTYNNRQQQANRSTNSAGTIASIIIRSILGGILVVGIPILIFIKNVAYNKVTPSIRVFGPMPTSKNVPRLPISSMGNLVSYSFYTRQEQRQFLASDEGGLTCQTEIMKSNNHYYQKIMQQSKVDDSRNVNFFVQRFDQLPAPYATELWKYCVLFTGHGNVYWQMDNLVPLYRMDDILGINTHHSTITGSDALSGRKRVMMHDQTNIVIQIDGSLHSEDNENLKEGNFSSSEFGRLHHSFMKLSKPKSKVALGMMLYLLDYDSSSLNNAVVPLDTISLQQTLSTFIANDQFKKRNSWSFWTAKCYEPEIVGSLANQQFGRLTNHMIDSPCLAEAEEACCQVWTKPFASITPPSLLIRHSNIVDLDKVSQNSLTSNALPYSIQERTLGELDDVTDEFLGMPKSHLPYISTVREYRTNAKPATIHETPNYFDILLRNNCLPHDKECFKCLKMGYKDGDDGGDCVVCHDKCPCYCDALCKVRPPPKRLVAEWIVTSPRFRKNPERIIPRIIHQTWFEPVTKEKYPNMSRLIESFRKSGWEYEFYNDDKAAQFLSAHFPPPVREAYDALIPGAFKADLFRYCVLLIRGGLYADMDILLESNLDVSVPPDVGFLTSQDSPGETIGHRSCLWNGLMAVAPGHPVLAQTIQTVVNNIRNRFTSVDYDDMLCPNPVLSVSHTVDTLFTCGPCIIGASLNDILKRHRQTGFSYGEIDLFATEKQEINSGKHRRASVHYLSLVKPDDPRWLIPGKIVLLKQNKDDMGSHRFTSTDKNLIVAVTDMPEYDDRPKSIEHYSKSHVKFGVYGLTKLYTNQDRANEEIRIRINNSPLIS